MSSQVSFASTGFFISCAAAGEDWREACRKILEKIEEEKKSQKPRHKYNFGFLYISDSLAEDAGSILNLFRSILEIEDWVGSVGIGVCGCGAEYVDQPAVSVLVGHFNKEDYCIFPAAELGSEEANAVLDPWLENHEPMLIFVHGDPMAEEDPARAIKALSERTGGFVSGGLASARKDCVQIAGELQNNGPSGVAFSKNIEVSTALSQGRTPIGEMHTVTAGEDHIIRELDNQKAVAVFEEDLRAMTRQKAGFDPDRVLAGNALEDNEAIPPEFQDLLKGEIHAAFPVSGCDMNDYLVRNIMGLDPDEGALMVCQPVNVGDKIMFVHRDNETMGTDLAKSIVQLCERVKKEQGLFAPKAAIYVSCLARAFGRFGNNQESELKLVRDIIGDIPLAGFYAGGEISKARLYGYTGILTLFL